MECLTEETSNQSVERAACSFLAACGAFLLLLNDQDRVSEMCD